MNIVCTSAFAGDFNAAHAAAVLAGATLAVDVPSDLTASIAADPAIGTIDFHGSATLDFHNYDLTGPSFGVDIRGPRRQLFNFSGTGRLKGTFGNEFHVEHFGASPLNVTGNETKTRQAFQYLYDYIFQSLRGNQGYDAWGPYYLMDNVSVTWSCANYTVPTARGCPGLGTSFITAPTVTTPVFLYTGGGGHISNARMDNFVFIGNGNTIGLELRGTTGMRGSIGMSGIKTGILLSTTPSQQAPELNVFDVYGDIADGNAIECVNSGGGGQASMHGSGLGQLTCLSHGSSPANRPGAAIKVGSGCALYNATLGGHYWNHHSQPFNLVENHSVGFDCSISHGEVSLEFGDSQPMNLADPRYSCVHFRHMPFVQGSHSAGLANSVICDYQSYNSGIASRKGARYTQEVPNLGASNSCPLNIPGGLSGGNPRIYSIFMESGDTNWQWQGFVIATPGSGTSGPGGCLAIGKTVKDTKGWGDPTFDSIGYTTQLRLKSLSGGGVNAEGIYCIYDIFDL